MGIVVIAAGLAVLLAPRARSDRSETDARVIDAYPEAEARVLAVVILAAGVAVFDGAPTGTGEDAHREEDGYG